MGRTGGAGAEGEGRERLWLLVQKWEPGKVTSVRVSPSTSAEHRGETSGRGARGEEGAGQAPGTAWTSSRVCLLLLRSVQVTPCQQSSPVPRFLPAKSHQEEPLSS